MCGDVINFTLFSRDFTALINFCYSERAQFKPFLRLFLGFLVSIVAMQYIWEMTNILNGS